MTTSARQAPFELDELLDVPGVESRRIVVRGLQHRVLTAGSGWPLLLLHGLAGSADELLGVLPRFAERYRVVAADAPGHGLSEKPLHHRYDVGYYADFILALMDTLGIQRAPVLAISGSGPVALSIALAHPHRLNKLVLVDAAGLGREVSWSYRVTTLPFMGRVFRRSLNRRSSEAFGRALCFRRDSLPDGWADRRMRIWETPGAVEAFITTVRAGVSLRGQKVNFARQLGAVRQPTLLVWGRQDPIIPVAHAIAAAKAIPNAQLRIFDRCGHMPLWEYPDEFVEVVTDFLG
jgi:4,5:9,10-diseco-3-hydroxy-5,9,17-trioxoandrosta-1(10),2-diene-4-oate hydrolase